MGKYGNITQSKPFTPESLSVTNNGNGTLTLNWLNASSLQNDLTNTLVLRGIGSSTMEGSVGVASTANNFFNIIKDFLTKYVRVLVSENLGLGGTTTYDIQPTGYVPSVGGRATPNVARNITECINGSSDVVLVFAPSNDALGGYDVDTETIANLKRVVNTAWKNGVKIFIGGANGRNLDNVGKARLADTNKKLMGEFGDIMIDYFSHVVDQNTEMQLPYRYSDNIHLNENGHKLIASLLIPKILAHIHTTTNKRFMSIERSTSAASGFSEIGRVYPGRESFLDDAVAPDTTYYYRVRALGERGNNSGYTNVGSGSASDTVAPVITFNPANASTGAVISSNLLILSNEPLKKTDGSTLVNGDLASLVTLKLTNSGGAAVPFTATISADKKTITVDPTSNLSYSQPYYIALAPVEDGSGNETSVVSAIFTSEANTSTIGTIKMNFGLSLASADSTWNDLNGDPYVLTAGPYTNISFSALKNTVGTITSVGVETLNTAAGQWGWTSAGNGAADNTGDVPSPAESGVYPDKVIRTNWYVHKDKDPAKVRITGLSNLKTYNLTLFGSRDGVNSRDTRYTITAGTVTVASADINVDDNKSITITLGPITPNVSGYIEFTVAPVVDADIYGYLTAGVLVENP